MIFHAHHVLAVDSAAGSNVGPFGDGSFHGSGNLDDVEEADIEAGQILTALKSSPSPIRSDSGVLQTKQRSWRSDFGVTVCVATFGHFSKQTQSASSTQQFQDELTWKNPIAIRELIKSCCQIAVSSHQCPIITQPARTQ